MERSKQSEAEKSSCVSSSLNLVVMLIHYQHQVQHNSVIKITIELCGQNNRGVTRAFEVGLLKFMGHILANFYKGCCSNLT